MAYLHNAEPVLVMRTQLLRFYSSVLFLFSPQHLFTPFDISAAAELTLGGDMVLADLKRLQWNYPHQDTDQATKKTGK